MKPLHSFLSCVTLSFAVFSVFPEVIFFAKFVPGWVGKFPYQFMPAHMMVLISCAPVFFTHGREELKVSTLFMSSIFMPVLPILFNAWDLSSPISSFTTQYIWVYFLSVLPVFLVPTLVLLVSGVCCRKKVA